MRYFMLKKDAEFEVSPYIVNWYGKLDIRYIKQGYYSRLSDRILLNIKASSQTVFTKLILDPFFLISEEIKECVHLYEPTLYFKEVVLLDEKNKQAEEYFLPTLEEVDCMTENCKYNSDHSQLLYTELHKSKIGSKSIFYLAHLNSYCVIVRLDVAESMVRRGANGFLLEEVRIVG